MKKILFILCLLPVLALGQTTSQNYVRTDVYKQPTTTSDATKANAGVTYFDGLGRPIQQVAGQMSNTGKDLLTHIEYDGFGRQPKQYLPFEAGTNNLSYVASAATDVVNFYNTPAFENTQNPYSEKFFEDSPLNRIMKQGAPGAIWQGNENDNDHTVKFAYLANTDADNVAKLKVTAQWDATYKVYTTSIVIEGNYAAGQLYKTLTQDENAAHAISTYSGFKSNVVEEYKNKEGQVVLKRNYYSTTDDLGASQQGTTNTYYAYDQFGNLAYVLPLALLPDVSATTLDLYAYQYKYDARNRLVEKKLPGRDWEFIVYDNLDRVVATGPTYSPFGTQNKGWLFTKYDDFGRVAYTGWRSVIEFSSYGRNALQNLTYVSEQRVTTPNVIDEVPVYYTNNSYTNIGLRLLTVNYYDDYSYPGSAVASTDDVEGLGIVTNAKGLPTVTWNRIVTTTAERFGELSTTFYDAKGRAVRTRVSNSQLGGYTETDTKLDFDGTPLYTKTHHKRTGDTNEPVLEVTNNFTYTAQDRLLSATHTIGGLSAELMSKNTYNAIGQLISKNVGRTEASPLQKVDFSYNIRGWLTGINKVTALRENTSTPEDLFAFKINYTDTDGVAGVQPLYNGNIAETTWRTGSDNIMRRYSYSYDNLNRLRDAYYQIPEAALPLRQSYDEHLKYDYLGNITRLQRNGGVDTAAQPVEIDDLTYTYTGNRLYRVADSSTSPQGFHDITTGTINDFDYDGFGNMNTDLSKGIAAGGIVYNHLNLPVKITINNTATGTSGIISYIYNGAGVKLKKTVTNNNTNPATITTTDYLNGFQYTNDVLDFFPTSEGYVKNTVVDGTNNYNYIYQYKDHLGNVRVSYTIDPADNTLKIMDESHYYPFGMKHEGYSADQHIITSHASAITLVPVVNPGDATYKYKYNGKELQDELELNMYDYGARNYDPALGRWMNIDPLASKYMSTSPYAYAINNPVYFIDIDGMQAGGPGDGDKTPAPVIAGELKEVVINATRTSSSNNSFNFAWLANFSDTNLGNAVFGKNLYKSYDKVFSTDDGRDFYKRLHQYDETETKVIMGVMSIVAPEIILPAVVEFGTMVLAGETLTIAVEGAEAVNVVVETEEAIVTLSEGATAAENGIVQLGEWGESRLAEVLGNAGTKPSSPYTTNLGKRYIDRLVDGIAHEAKAGLNVRLTSSIRRQILKDAELITTGEIKGAVWHFFRGADSSVTNFLTEKAIPFIIH